MPLVINALGGGHTRTHIPTHEPKQFQKSGMRSLWLLVLGLKFLIVKRGIGIERKKYASKLEIKKHGNKLKMGFNICKTKVNSKALVMPQ